MAQVKMGWVWECNSHVKLNGHGTANAVCTGQQEELTAQE